MADAQQGRLFHVDQLPVEGRTELGLAAARGDRDEITRLIDSGASVSGQDAYQDTPLHLAALFGQLEAVKLLLREYQAKVDPVNSEGWTPVCCAVSRGHSQVVKLLLRYGANGNWVSPIGWQLMHIAAWYHQDAMVHWLAEHGAQTAPKTLHAARPFDMTRPGPIRCTLFEAMEVERHSRRTPPQ